jgi:cob(I)alamin adenosyltransferase
MPLYTRNGDTGDTQLYGGTQVSKTNPRIHAYGTVDELDAILGVIRAELNETDEFKARLITLQKTLYRLKADLATPGQHAGKAMRLTDDHVTTIEKWIDEAEESVEPLRHFVLPGGTKIAAELHLARTVCRRAERWVVELSRAEPINFCCLRYLNRLGDYLFALARVSNTEEGIEEERAE